MNKDRSIKILRWVLFAGMLSIPLGILGQTFSHVEAVAEGKELWNTDINKSIEVFKQEIAKNPSNHYAINQLAHAYKSNHEYFKAIEVFKRLLDTPEYRTDVLLFLAEVCFQVGDFDQGLDYFEMGINLGFSNLYNSGFRALSTFRSADYFDELQHHHRFKALIEKARKRPFDPIVQYLSWSPDGTQLAIQAALNGSGSYDLYIYDLTRNDLQRITYTRASEMAPKWSPDGSWIAFHRENLYGGAKELFLVKPDGAEERQITNQNQLPGNKSFPSWSPDSKSIVFVAQNHPDRHEIYRLTLEDKQYNQLTDTTGFKSNPSVNEHQQLVYDVQLTENSYSLVKKDLTTGKHVLLTSNNWWWTPTWIDDGARIITGYYATGDTMFNRIAIMDSDGSNKKYITPYGTDSWYPAPSHDGRKLAFASPVSAFFMGGAVLKVMDLETGEILAEIDLSKL